MRPRLARPRASSTWLAAALLAALAAFYLAGLTSWRVNDDEGSYLYAAWRMSLGAVPYRDFLTPQLPAFLEPGAVLMRLVGPDAWAARALSVAAVLAAGATWWAVARRLFGAGVALAALAAFLLHPDVYAACRTFRPEPFMLLAQALGTWAFARAVLPDAARAAPPRRAWLAAAGALFGLATLTKLFGPWPLAGLLAWLLDDARRRGRPWRAVAGDLGTCLAAGAAVVAAGMARVVLAAGGDTVWAATVGHHLRQGAGKPAGAVLDQGVALFALYVRDAGRGVPAVVGAAYAAHVLRRGPRAERLVAWPLLTAVGFLLLARDRYPRHLLYLAPTLGLLLALGLRRLAGPPPRGAAASPDAGVGSGAGPRNPAGEGEGDGAWPRLAAAATLFAVLLAWGLTDRDYVQARREDGTQRVGDLVALLTGPDDLVLSDYSELNFYARRPTTYSAASLSSGAVRSGQISWSRLRGELAGAGEPALLALERDSPYSHLRYLAGPDRADFDAWRAARYEPAGTLVRTEAQRFEILRPRGRPLTELARFGGGPTLLAAEVEPAAVAAGASTSVRTAWRAPGPDVDRAALGPLGMTLRLVDEAGRTVAQADAGLLAAGGRDLPAWLPDELTALRVALPVPPGTAPGAYALRLAVYRRADLSTLPARDAGGADLGPAAHLADVTVTAWIPGRFVDRRAALGLDAPPADLGAPHDGLALVGVGAPPAAPVVAGEVVPVTLAWRVTGPPEAAAVRLTLVDPVSGATAADRRAALGAAGASVDWPLDSIVARTVSLPVRADAAAGRYGLTLTLEDADGRPLTAPTTPLAVLEVTARDLADRVFDRARLPAFDAAPGTRLGEVGTLVGATFPAALAAGATATVTLYWHAAEPSATPLQATVQLLGPDGRPRAQHDGPPAGGARPTTGWLPGEYVADAHPLAVPADLPPGDYALVAALYPPLTGRRLPAVEPPGDGLVPLGTVRVGAP